MLAIMLFLLVDLFLAFGFGKWRGSSDLLFDSGLTVPPPPSDGEVKKVADKLALFVAKNGRQFEDITRQKNPGNTPFR